MKFQWEISTGRVRLRSNQQKAFCLQSAAEKIGVEARSSRSIFCKSCWALSKRGGGEKKFRKRRREKACSATDTEGAHPLVSRKWNEIEHEFKEESRIVPPLSVSMGHEASHKNDCKINKSPSPSPPLCDAKRNPPTEKHSARHKTSCAPSEVRTFSHLRKQHVDAGRRTNEIDVLFPNHLTNDKD